MIKTIMGRTTLAAVACALSLSAHAIADSPKQIDVPAGELVTALESLARQADVSLIYQAKQLAGIHTRGVHGSLTPQEAVTKLLEGTKFHIRTDATSGAMLIERPGSNSAAASGEGRNADPPKKSFWDRFQMAQADQGTNSNPSVSTSASQGGEQKDTSAPITDTDAMALQEVVVTATRRSESLEKVPISITALTQDQLTAGEIKGIADIAAVTPGLQFSVPNAFASSITAISIRGMNATTGQSVVGIYLDDTPIQGRLSPIGNFGSPYPVVFDLNRVEVERGPQGTLFGAGSEAGAVRFITNQPSLTQFSGFSHAEVGTTDGGSGSYEVGVAAGGPIVQDNLGFRVSAWDRHDGGYVNLVDPTCAPGCNSANAPVVDHNTNTADKRAVKAALAFQANASTLITPSILYQEVRSGDSGNFWAYFSDPSHGQFNNGAFFPEVTTDQFVLSSIKSESKLSFADLTATAAYTHRHASENLDASADLSAVGAANYGSPLGLGFPTSPSDVAPVWTRQSVQAFTEEVRLASNQPNAFVSWVAGIFNDHRTQVDSASFYSQVIDPTGAPVLYAYQPVTDEQIAVFAQGDFHLTTKMTATVGIREAREKTNFSIRNGTGLFNAGEPPYASSSLTETPFTPRLALSYQADSNDLYYVSASKGFRIGGGNAPLANFCDYTAPKTFNSDHVWSYEVGAKNTLLDGRVQIDSSVFYANWSQIQQLLQPLCGLQYTANGGSAVSKGFDLALQGIVTEGLRVNLDVAYADAYFTSSVYDNNGALLIQRGDKVGLLPQVNAPWNVNTSTNYEIPILQSYKMHLTGEFLYNSRNPGPFITQIPPPGSYFPGIVADPPTHLFNARLGGTTGKLDVSLFVNNVFNSHPLLAKYQYSYLSDLYIYRTLRPRTAGLSVNYAF
jgi:iron complex outermembrane recepter protein